MKVSPLDLTKSVCLVENMARRIKDLESELAAAKDMLKAACMFTDTVQRELATEKDKAQERADLAAVLGYESGAASRQSEIDELRAQLRRGMSDEV